VAALIPAAAPAAKPGQSFPLGDGRIVTSGPALGRALACAPPASPASPADPLPWMVGRRWTPSRRPVVDGAVVWPRASFELDETGLVTDFAGNGLPVLGRTGAFPPPSGDDARPFATGAAALAEHDVRGSFRERPRARGAACIDPSLPVAIAADGVPILASFDGSGRDLVAREVTDRCGGRTDAAGLYRYRGAVPCLGRRGTGRAHSGPVGWARDGFALYGPRGTRGMPLRSDDLDACHGHRHRVGASKASVYHYHLTPDFPYSIGCFRARPAPGWATTQRGTADEPPAGPPADVPPASPPADVPPPAGDSPPTPSPEPDPPALDEASVTIDPALFPGFDVAVEDYVVRCGPDPVEVTADAPEGLTVAIDGGAPKSGPQSVEVDLEGGQAFRFTIANRTAQRTFHVRCLPANFPGWTVERIGDPAAQWYFASPSFEIQPRADNPYAIAYDDRGVPVWWRDVASVPVDVKLLPNGNVAWFRGKVSRYANYPSDAYEERELDGTLVRTLATVGSPTDLHEIQLMPSGNYLMVTYRARDGEDLGPYGGASNATVLDAEVQELTPAGTLVWSWNAKDHVSLDETGRWWPTVLGTTLSLEDGRAAYDHQHINSVELDGDGIVISLRHTDAIYRIDRATGAVDWKLGGTPTPASLSFVGDAFSGSAFGGQHDPRVGSDGTVTLFDNGTDRGRPPRAVRYAIDPVARTATLVEQVRDPLISGSFCCGSARRLSGGNWVVYWGGTSTFGELSADREVVLRVIWDNQLSYRVAPVEPGVLSAADVRAAMDAMNPR
jgi:hypothetical protein